MNDMQPIETKYNGIVYRSRLEARWAMYFESLPCSFYYEPEGFNFGSVWYLPDFQVIFPVCKGLEGAWEYYVEIKPTGGVSDEAIKKCELLCNNYGGNVVLLEGFPAEHIAYFFVPGKKFEKVKNWFVGDKSGKLAEIAAKCTHYQFGRAKS